MESNAIKPGNRGTRQRSVLSPFLFNVAMIGVPKIFNRIESLQHSLYADDVTLWVTGASDGHIQDKLQQAIEAVQDYVGIRGLNYSPLKSELLLHRKTSRGRRTFKTPPEAHLFAGGGTQCIPIVTSIRVFVLGIQANGHNSETIRALKKVSQITRLISRIANRHHGMKELNLLRLVEIFILSRITYATPFFDIKRDEEHKIYALIRRAYKKGIGIPLTSFTEHFEALGLQIW